MSFGYPHLLWLLLLVPAVAVLVWWSFRVKARAMQQFIGLRLLPALTVGLSRARQKARAALFVSAFALALFALARPQWGFDLEEARQRGLDIVVAIDTSKSMLADDVSPNRLSRARLAALDLMRAAQSDRLGLVAFAGTAFLQCPLSLDDEAFRQSLDALDANIIPQGGTALSEAIQTALSAFKEQTENHKVLVLFTDGEDHDPQGTALEAARDAAKAGMRIFTIGVGTPSGELLSSRDPYGNRVFIKDAAGNVVKSRLNEALLQQISKETDGFYLPLSAGTVDMLYERGLAPLPKAEFSARTMRRYHERFQWFLGAAILLLLAEMFFPERARRKRLIEAPAKQAVAVALVACTCFSASASVTDALQSYKRGKFSKARTEYERLARKSPEDARLRYNAGAAAFQDEDYDEALRHFSSTLSARDLSLQQQGYYNLGNTQYRLGEQAKDAKEKQQNWEQAIQSYNNALRLQPKDEDARINKQVVQAKLEELKKQQQQQQNKDDQKQDKDDQQKQDQQKQDEQKNQQDQSKQDQDKQDQQQQSEEQKQDKQQPQQQQQDQAKADQNKDQQAAQDQRGDKPDQNAQPADFSKVMQMTPQQAAQLLEAQKAEEKTMIFLPQVRTNKSNKTPDRVFKDW